MNLKDFTKADLTSANIMELNPEKTYLVLYNVTSLRYTDSFLENVEAISKAFNAAGIKSIILVNPMEGGVSQFEIGVNKEIKSERI